MSSKRKRVAVELPSVGQAALPAVCYMPSLLSKGNDASTSGTSTAGNAATNPWVKRLKFSMHAKSGRQGPMAPQLVHACHGEIDYVGRSDGDENAGVQPCCYALGIYKPEEGKLQLVSVAADRLFRLDTRLQGLQYAPSNAGGTEEKQAYDVRKAAAKRLVDEFGSTRRRRQMTAREAGVVSADRISGGEAVQEMLGGLANRAQDEGVTKEEMLRRAFARRTVPPHDPAATTPATAYPLDLLLSRGEGGAGGGGSSLVGQLNVQQIHRLAEDDEELEKATAKEWVNPYVLGRLGPLRALKSKTEDPEAVSRAKLRARYLALLAALFTVQSKNILSGRGEGSTPARELHMYEGLTELMLEKFYSRTEDPIRGVRYERTDAQRQLLLSYILAVAVVAEDGFLDGREFEALRTALKMDGPKLSAALQQIGCSVKATRLRVNRMNVDMEITSFTATLLRNVGKVEKTLADCFPPIKLAKGKGGGR